jgi:formylglycine-generating enzyme required for sulfatase activity
MPMPACCLPDGPAGPRYVGECTRGGSAALARDPRAVRHGMLAIPGGGFSMGGDDADAFPDDGEGPVRTVELRPFYVDWTCVTNAQFAGFVKATGYVTEAERFGWSRTPSPLLSIWQAPRGRPRERLPRVALRSHEAVSGHHRLLPRVHRSANRWFSDCCS